jgi:hypothetical protein
MTAILYSLSLKKLAVDCYINIHTPKEALLQLRYEVPSYLMHIRPASDHLWLYVETTSDRWIMTLVQVFEKYILHKAYFSFD